MTSTQSETYTIHIEGEWSLEDLYLFPRAFEQVYFLVYSLMPEHDEDALERIHHAYPYLHCSGGLKGLQTCALGGMDITLIVGIGLFWCPLLSYVTIPVSLWAMFSVWAKWYRESLPPGV